MPDINEYPKLKDFWDDFIECKKSEAAQHMSVRNKANSEKNVYPHRLGTGGYRKKNTRMGQARRRACTT